MTRVNPMKGEVALPEIGQGYFIAFRLADIQALEAEYGKGIFYGKIEEACLQRSYTDLPKILAIGLRKRNSKGEVEKVGEEFDFDELLGRDDFDIESVYLPVLDSVSLSWLNKTRDQVVEEFRENQKNQDAENLKRAKEAAEAADLPFSEALSDGLFKLLTHMASTQSPSGN